MRLAALALPAALILNACAGDSPPPPTMGHGMTTVSVTVTYRERIRLTPGHTLSVRLEDVSLADAPARTLAEHSEQLDGRAPPYQTTLGVPQSQIDPNRTYAVRADIRDAAGALRFTTDTRHAVLTRGAPSSADIVLVGVR